MQRILISVLALSHARIDGYKLMDTLTKLGYIQELRYVDSEKDLPTMMLECIIEPIVEKELEAMGLEPTIERMNYMVKDLMEGDSINLPLLDELKEQIVHAVNDRKIEMEGMQ